MHLGHGIHVIPQEDGSVKIQKHWNNQPEAIELTVNVSKDKWLEVVKACEHKPEVKVSEVSAPAIEAPKAKKGIFS